MPGPTGSGPTATQPTATQPAAARQPTQPTATQSINRQPVRPAPTGPRPNGDEAIGGRGERSGPGAGDRGGSADQPGAGAGAGGRLEWLDALRGFAALAVVYWHLGPRAILGPPTEARQWVDIGKYGVVLFFVISGYVIPMSLDRYASLRRFWVGRLFRLYPAFLVASAAMLAVYASGAIAPPRVLTEHPVTTVTAHATMLQGLLGAPQLVPVYWTLSYEMVFYLAAAGMFVLGLHRFAGGVAAGLAAVAALAGPLLPGSLLTARGELRGEVAALLVVGLAGTVAGYASGHRRIAVVCAVAGVGALALPAFNGGTTTARDSWQSLTLVAVMFAGTVVYRVERGLTGRVGGGVAVAAVLAAALAGGWWHLPAGAERRIWLSTLTLTAVTFAVAYGLRRRPAPRLALWCGKLSYSIYLLHLVVLYAVYRSVPFVPDRPFAQQVALLVAYLLALFLAAHLTYRWAERPGRRLGRRLTAGLDRWLGPAVAPAPRRDGIDTRGR
ncbi:MAG TPA: acyltransferase [Pilimelia sp.]|nr:acyltransferase [Pilimelia sp.]